MKDHMLQANAEAHRVRNDPDNFTPVKDFIAAYNEGSYYKKLEKINKRIEEAEKELDDAQQPILDYNKKKK